MMTEEQYAQEMEDFEQQLADGVITHKKFMQYVRELDADFGVGSPDEEW